MRILFIASLLVMVSYITALSQINQNSNPSVIGISLSQDVLTQNGGAYLEAAVWNTGSDPMPAGTFRVYIGISTDLEFDPVSLASFPTNYPGWRIVSSGSVLTLENTVTMGSTDLASFQIGVKLKPEFTGSKITSATLRVGVTPGRGSQAGNADNSLIDDNGSTEFALPVVLTGFNALAESNLVNLYWSTTWETNSDRFEIERSATGKNWQRIGTVKSHGESQLLKNYTLTDASPLNGTNYYRLKMIDRDGTYDFSRIVNAIFAGSSTTIYPNPAIDHFKVNKSEQVATIKITDLTGRKLSSHQYELQEGNIVNVNGVPAGLYLVTIEDINGNRSTQKLFIGK